MPQLAIVIENYRRLQDVACEQLHDDPRFGSVPALASEMQLD